MGVDFNANLKGLFEKLNVGKTGGTEKPQNGQQTREAKQSEKIQSTDIYTLAKEYGLSEEDMKALEQSANFGVFDTFSSSGSTEQTEEADDEQKEKELALMMRFRNECFENKR